MLRAFSTDSLRFISFPFLKVFSTVKIPFAFAIFNLQARGEMFVTHNDPVYEGMIVGLTPKPGDMIILEVTPPLARPRTLQPSAVAAHSMSAPVSRLVSLL